MSRELKQQESSDNSDDDSNNQITQKDHLKMLKTSSFKQHQTIASGNFNKEFYSSILKTVNKQADKNLDNIEEYDEISEE